MNMLEGTVNYNDLKHFMKEVSLQRTSSSSLALTADL